MSETNVTKRPEVIRDRADAVQLWKHLLTRGISFHWEDDPGDWVDSAGEQVLTVPEVATVRRLLSEVDQLEDPRCYDDAGSLLKLALLVGPASVSGVPARDAGAFEACGTPAQAIRILEQLH